MIGVSRRRRSLLGRAIAPSGGRRLDRTADFIGCFAALLGLVLSTNASVYQWRHHQMTPRDTWLIGVLLPATACTTAWVLIRVIKGRPARIPLAAHTTLCLFGVLVAALFWQVTPGQLTPSLAHSAVLGAAAAWSCFTWPVAVADILVTVVIGGTVLTGTDALGTLSWANSAYYGAIGMVATMCWTAVVTTVRMAQRASRESRRSAEELIRSEEALAESNRWDALIHDKVLNALGTAAKAVRPEIEGPARTLARDALDALRRTGDRTHPERFTDQIRAAARGLGLDADVRIEGTPSAVVAESFQRAAAEALTNVARHSGVAAVVVSGAFTAEEGELVVRDEGCGFDPGQVPDDRRGLRGSVLETMETRGGRAEIVSAPGQGTTVSMSWRAPEPWTVRISELGSFRTMVAFFLLALAISLSLGVPCSPYVIDWRIGDAGLAVLVLSVVGAMAWPWLNWWKCTLLASATVTAQIFMLANLNLTMEVGWQEWFIGFSLGVFTPLAWRTRRRRWCLYAALSFPVVTILGALLGGYDPLWLMASRASSFTFPVVMSMAAAWASSSMDSALEVVRASRTRTLDALRRGARAEAVRLEAERRLATIEGAPLSMLERLASGERIDAGVRRECVLLEASTRDLLLAPYVLDEEMKERFRAARERGATIVITGSDNVDAGHTRAAGAFRQACSALAALAVEGARLTCRWHPGSPSGEATVALSAPSGSVRRGLGAPLRLGDLELPEGVETEIIDADDDILVTLRAVEPG